jgi:hypothetical protein
VQGGRNHEDHRLADVHHPLAGQRRAMGKDQLLAPTPDERRMLGDVTDTGRVHVGRGEHRQDAGGGLCLIDLDRADIGKGVRRADEIAVRLAGKRHIGGIVAAAANQSVIFDARAFLRALMGFGIHLISGGRKFEKPMASDQGHTR